MSKDAQATDPAQIEEACARGTTSDLDKLPALNARVGGYDGFGQDRRLPVRRGAIRIDGRPGFSLHCHCRDCQRSSGTAYIAAMRVPADRFRITHGTPKRYIVKSG